MWAQLYPQRHTGRIARKRPTGAAGWKTFSKVSLLLYTVAVEAFENICLRPVGSALGKSGILRLSSSSAAFGSASSAGAVNWLSARPLSRSDRCFFARIASSRSGAAASEPPRSRALFCKPSLSSMQLVQMARQGGAEDGDAICSNCVHQLHATPSAPSARSGGSLHKAAGAVGATGADPAAKDRERFHCPGSSGADMI